MKSQLIKGPFVRNQRTGTGRVLNALSTQIGFLTIDCLVVISTPTGAVRMLGSKWLINEVNWPQKYARRKGFPVSAGGVQFGYVCTLPSVLKYFKLPLRINLLGRRLDQPNSGSSTTTAACLLLNPFRTCSTTADRPFLAVSEVLHSRHFCQGIHRHYAVDAVASSPGSLRRRGPRCAWPSLMH
jgi:hypothetical protein